MTAHITIAGESAGSISVRWCTRQYLQFCNVLLPYTRWERWGLHSLLMRDLKDAMYNPHDAQIHEADDNFKANGSQRGPGGRGGREPGGPPPGGQNGPPPQFGGGNGPGGRGGRGGVEISLEAIFTTFHSWQTLGHDSLDASVRRPPSCVEHHDRGKRRRINANPHMPKCKGCSSTPSMGYLDVGWPPRAAMFSLTHRSAR